MSAFLNASGAGTILMTIAGEDMPPRNQRDTDHTGAVDETIGLTDLRRPGRKEVNPTLIPLLRIRAEEGKTELIAQSEEAGDLVDPEEEDDAFRPSRGVLLAVLLSLPFWSIVAVLVAWMRR